MITLMHGKDFDRWNEYKKKIEHREPKSCVEREIWWSSLGVNIGYEQSGTDQEHKRPVVVLKRINDTTCFIIPITTSNTQSPYRIPLGVIRKKESWATISQLRMIDTRRLSNRMGKVDKETFEKIRKALTEFL